MFELLITNYKLAIGAIIGTALGVASVYFINLNTQLSTTVEAGIIAIALFLGLLGGAIWEQK